MQFLPSVLALGTTTLNIQDVFQYQEAKKYYWPILKIAFAADVAFDLLNTLHLLGKLNALTLKWTQISNRGAIFVLLIVQALKEGTKRDLLPRGLITILIICRLIAEMKEKKHFKGYEELPSLGSVWYSLVSFEILTRAVLLTRSPH